MHPNRSENSNYTSPLIERDTFFGNPEITASSLSPDGKYISFIKAYEGVLNIWIKTVEADFSEARPLTKEDKRPIRSYFWTWDSKYIIYAQDTGGDENFSLFRVDPRSKDTEAYLLTPEENTTSYVVSLPKAFPDKIFIALNDRDKAWHDYYEMDISSGSKKCIFENTEKLNSLYLDLQGQAVFAGRSLSDGGNEILEISPDGSLNRIFKSSLEESISPLKFREDGKAYFISNLGDPDLAGLYLYDRLTQNLEFIESDPQKEVDIENAVFSASSNELIATVYVGDKKRIYWKDDSYKDDYDYLQAKFPQKEISISSTTLDEKSWIIYVSSDDDPGSAYFFSRENKELDFLYSPRPKLSEASLIKMEAVHFNSLDGLKIPAYISFPPVKEKKDLPAVIMVHGGPWARDYWGYNSYAQFLANRGYVVMQVNFRGSTGFGKAFLNAAINQWGEKMQDDITAAAHYLSEKAYARPDKIAIMGGSYGGYATLAGLCFTPDLYAAGVSIVGPSNLFTLLETIPPYWESARVMFHKRMGDPTTESGRAQLKRQSPFFHADKIKAPLLVAQGANDPRVKKSESDQIVIAMRDHGLPVEYLNFPDEGHGFARPENSMAFISVMEKFLAHHLGGRYQDTVNEKLEQIISNARVDIAGLEMPEILSESQRKASMPLATKTPATGTFPYTLTIDMQGQEIEFELERSIRLEGNMLTLEDKAGSGMNEMEENTLIKLESFQAASKSMKQGPLEIEIQFEKDRISGSMSMNDKKTMFEKQTDLQLLADGNALDCYIASLNLAAGEEHILRLFDSQRQNIILYKLMRQAKDHEINGYACTVYELRDIDDAEIPSLYYVADIEEVSVLIRKEQTVKEMNGARVIMQLSDH